MPPHANRPLIIDDADRRPAIPHRPPHALISGADFDRPPRAPAPTLPWQAWVIVALVVAGLVVFLVVRIDAALRNWSYSGPIAGWLYANAPALIVFGLVGSGLYWLG